MNSRYFLFLFISVFFMACGDEYVDVKNTTKVDEGKNEETTNVLAWIEDTMREHYYWDLPATGNLDYTATTESFFTSLLSDEDGKFINGKHNPYSYITSLEEKNRGFIQEVTYGFEFSSVALGDGNYGAVILYVLPGSPASEAGIKRGDIIKKINGQPINTDAVLASLYGDFAKTFTVENYDAKTGELVNSREVSISAARQMDNNPILMSDVIIGNNKKIGYLVYNQFEMGEGENTMYDDQLRQLSSGKFNGVDEFILDLRYNNGGYLSSAQLLCSMLCPNDKLGSTLGYLEYKSGEKTALTMDKDILIPGGHNLNLNTVYILVSSMSASASEAVINFLKPYMEVYVIGRQTQGKNVASHTFIDDAKNWEMHPITCLVENSENFSDYSDGIKPDFDRGDIFEYDSRGYVSFTEVLPLGDPKERLMRVALELIKYNSIYGDEDEISSGRSVHGTFYKEGPIRSLDRKASNGVLIK